MTELNPVADLALLRVLQLASPALPIGAYAYSQGLEYAIEQNWVTDIDSAAHWLGGLLGHSLARLDIPLLLRQYDALERDDEGALFSWNDWLLANRETAELYLEDSQQGGALLRLLKSLAVPAALEWPQGEPIALMTALATRHCWQAAVAIVPSVPRHSDLHFSGIPITSPSTTPPGKPSVPPKLP